MEKIKKNRFLQNLKSQAEEHPLETIIIAGVAVTAAAKLMAASTERKRANAWDKEVNRRIEMSR